MLLRRDNEGIKWTEEPQWEKNDEPLNAAASLGVVTYLRELTR